MLVWFRNREAGRFILFLLLLAAIACFANSDARCGLAAQRRPNVVMIISDDQKYSDFGFMGNKQVLTPNLDRLAKESSRYPNGYVPSSVCRPSLVTLLTGIYPHQHGVHFNHPPPGFAKLTKSPSIDKAEFDRFRRRGAALIQSVPTLPRILAAEGYRCFQTGKYWEGHWRNAGFTEGMTTAEPSGGQYGDKQLANGDWVAHGNGDHGLAIGRQTMQPIEDFLDDVQDNPFFLWYAPFLPHTPHDAPERFVRPLKARHQIKSHQLPYFAAISQFDDSVGQLIHSIERRGLSQNTLFVFIVDNGWEPDPNRFRVSHNEWDHTKNSKRSPFDAGLRTPILLCWQGKTVAATHPAPVSSIDLMPTILNATEADAVGLQLPGRDLWASATGNGKLSDQVPVFGELYPGDATVIGDPVRDLAYRWVRRGRYKLIVPRKNGTKPPWNNYLDASALYDVVLDPGEEDNRIADPGMTLVRQELSNTLDGWWSPNK